MFIHQQHTRNVTTIGDTTRLTNTEEEIFVSEKEGKNILMQFKLVSQFNSNS